MRLSSRLGLLLPVVAVAVAAVGFVVLLDEQPPTATPAPVPAQQVDLSDLTTARLEALLNESRDDPGFVDEIPGVTLVLAERHFTAAAYDRAFELYAAVVEHPATRPPQFAVSLSRMGWIAWLTTGDARAALSTIEQSLSVDPANAETLYIKGQILWCGLGEATQATGLFETVLRAPDLTDGVRAQVTGDLRAVRAGDSCG